MLNDPSVIHKIVSKLKLIVVRHFSRNSYRISFFPQDLKAYYEGKLYPLLQFHTVTNYACNRIYNEILDGDRFFAHLLAHNITWMPNYRFYNFL